MKKVATKKLNESHVCRSFRYSHACNSATVWQLVCRRSGELYRNFAKNNEYYWELRFNFFLCFSVTDFKKYFLKCCNPSSSWSPFRSFLCRLSSSSLSHRIFWTPPLLSPLTFDDLQFSIIIKPLFESFNGMVSTTSLKDLNQTAMAWLDQHCSLPVLRPSKWSSIQQLFQIIGSETIYNTISWKSEDGKESTWWWKWLPVPLCYLSGKIRTSFDCEDTWLHA